jgi:formylmethanofuran dehydrogenase subunit C
MNILPDRCHATRGSALFTVLIIMGVLSLVTTSMVYMALQQPFNVRRTRDQIRAQDVAEAGANIAFAMLSTNFSLKDNAGAFPLTPYRGGTYDVTVTSFSPTSAVISSVGVVNATKATVALDILCTSSNLPSGQPAPTGAYACAVMSGGAMTWSGNSTLNMGGGKLHSNTSLQISGNAGIIGNVSTVGKMTMSGNTTIQGNSAAASYSLSGNNTITGTKTTGTVAPIPIPNIDLTPYYNTALANGQVYSSSQNFSGNYSFTPPGGIMWVNGDLSFSGNGVINGCIMATGNITVSGNITQSQQTGNFYPSLASQNGSITLSGNSFTQNGLIYTKTGDITISGNVALYGSIISAGVFTLSGNFTAFNYQNSTPVPPGGGSGGSQQTGATISGWRQ